MCCEFVTVCLANELLPDIFVGILLQTYTAFFHLTVTLFRYMLGVAANDSVYFSHTQNIR